MDLTLTKPAVIGLDNHGDIIADMFLRTNAKEAELDRIRRIKDEVIWTVNKSIAMAERVAVFIEGYAFGKNTGKVFTRAEVIGVIKVCLLDIPNVELYTVSPTTVKSYMAGHGHHDKKAMIEMVKTNFGYNARNDDIADAYSIAQFGLSVLRDKEALKYSCLYDGFKAL